MAKPPPKLSKLTPVKKTAPSTPPNADAADASGEEVQPVAEETFFETVDSEDGSEDVSGYIESDRTLPGPLELVRPGNVLHWIWNFVESWFLSRPYHGLLAAVPYLVIALGGSGFVWWLRGAPLDDLVTNYETAVKTAIRNEDYERAGIYLHSVSVLRPANQQYRFQLALHELEHGNRTVALQVLQQLTTADDGHEAYMPALKWLVLQAIEPEPMLPISDDLLQQELQTILNKQPYDLPANQILADLHIRRQQFKAAEDHMLRVINEVPAMGLALARVQRILKRPNDQVERHLWMSEKHYAEQLLLDTRDTSSRTLRAEALTMLEKFGDAERVLKEGLALEGNGDNPKLRSALGRIYATLATRRLAESALNTDSGVRLLTAALEYDPSNTQIVQQVFRVTQAGGRFSPEVYAGIIQRLKAADSQEPANRLLLAQALDSSGATEQAMAVTRPLVEEHPQYRPLLVRLLQKTGQHAEADKLVQAMLDEFAAEETDDPASAVQTALRRAEVLSLARRFAESVVVLEQHPLPRQLKNATTSPVYRLWNTLYGRGCLAVYDEKLKGDGFGSDTEAIDLLNKALQTRTVAISVIDRLAKLSYSDNPIAATAEDRLNKILASGVASPAVYNLMGTHALQLGRAGAARKHLERAHSLAKHDPMIMNNLALAHVRDDGGTPDRALDLANEMLEIIPEHPDALSTRGEVLAALGRWDEARRDLELALPHRPRSRTTRLLLAKVYKQLGQPDLSKEHMQIVASIDAAEGDGPEGDGSEGDGPDGDGPDGE